HGIIRQRNHAGVAATVRFGKLLLRPLGNGAHAGLGLSESDARLQQAYDSQIVAAPILLLLLVKDERRPHLTGVVGIVELCRHDPNHSELLSVQVDGLAHNAWITTEVLLPKTVFEHNYLLAS